MKKFDSEKDDVKSVLEDFFKREPRHVTDGTQESENLKHLLGDAPMRSDIRSHITDAEKESLRKAALLGLEREKELQDFVKENPSFTYLDRHLVPYDYGARAVTGNYPGTRFDTIVLCNYVDNQGVMRIWEFTYEHLAAHKRNTDNE